MVIFRLLPREVSQQSPDALPSSFRSRPTVRFSWTMRRSSLTGQPAPTPDALSWSFQHRATVSPLPPFSWPAVCHVAGAGIPDVVESRQGSTVKVTPNKIVHKDALEIQTISVLVDVGMFSKFPAIRLKMEIEMDSRNG